MTGGEFLLWLKLRTRRRGECLLWRGACPHGGPQTRHPEHSDDRVQVRRLVLEMGGSALAARAEIVTSCGRDRCVFAGHLRVSSRAEIISARPVNTHCRKGHPYERLNGRNWCRPCSLANQRAHYRMHGPTPWPERRVAPTTGELTLGQRQMLDAIRTSNRLGLALSMAALRRMLFPGRKGHDTTGRNLRALEVRGLVQTVRKSAALKSQYVSIVARPASEAA